VHAFSRRAFVSELYMLCFMWLESQCLPFVFYPTFVMGCTPLQHCLGQLGFLPSVGWQNELSAFALHNTCVAAVSVDDIRLIVDSQSKLAGLVWGSAATWRCSVFIRWNLQMTVMMIAAWIEFGVFVLLLLLLVWKLTCMDCGVRVWQWSTNISCVECSCI